MRSLLTLIICALMLHSCKTNAPASGIFTPPHDWPIPDSVASKLKLQIDNGGAEYFTVNKSNFRFKKSTNEKDKYDLDVSQNGTWVNNLTLPMARYGFFLSPDFDLDGFFDLSYHRYGNVEIYFFDSAKKKI